MSRNRQSAKQRQAERRAARLEARTRGPVPPGEARPEDADWYGAEPDSYLADPNLGAGAPPQDVGRSDTVLGSPPPAPDVGGDDLSGDEWYDDDGGLDPSERRSRGGPERAAPDEGPEHGRIVTFLIAVWAELGRVQWPDRQTLTTLTGIVLGFVVIAGGYLGLLDAVFSRLIKALL